MTKRRDETGASSAAMNNGSELSRLQTEYVPPKLEAKFTKLQSARTWGALVPKPFIVLITFCMTFTTLSLIGLLVAATTPHIKTSKSQESNGDDETTSSALLLGIGVCSSIVGSLQTAAGYCAQRLGHQINALTYRHHPVPPAKVKPHPLFFVGILLLVFGTVAAIINLGILGQSVTAPFAAMTLIFNGCLASVVLHEPITRFDIVATIIVLLGVGIAMVGVGMAQLDVQIYTVARIEEIFGRTPLPACYSAIVLGTLATAFTFIKKLQLETRSLGLCFFSVGAGVLSGFSSLCVKCTVEILKSAAKAPSGDLHNPVLYLFVLGIPLCVLSQLKLMTLGLQHFGTLKFVPPYHAFIILSNLINGMVFFDEAKGHDFISATLFILGCGVTVSGVFVLLAKADVASSRNKGRSSSTKTTSSSESDLDSTPTHQLNPHTPVCGHQVEDDGVQSRESLDPSHVA